MDTINIAIPAVGEAFKFYARVTAQSAKRECSLPIQIHFIGMEEFSRVADVSRFGDYHGSSITWSRLYLTEIFPDLDWVISADADVMFRGDVAELWKLRDEQIAILPSRDSPMPGHRWNTRAVSWYEKEGLDFLHPEEYFCAGLALVNLKLLREIGWAEKRDAFLKEHDVSSMPYADQCVLNWLLRDDKRLLPRGWGVFSGDANSDIDWSKPCAVHFVEDTPWRRWKVTHLVSDLCEMWWDCADELMLEKNCIHDNQYAYRGCRSRFDWCCRRAGFQFFKYNQWILKLNSSLWFHLRSTRGIRANVLCE